MIVPFLFVSVSTVLHNYNSSTAEPKAGRAYVRGQPGIYFETLSPKRNKKACDATYLKFILKIKVIYLKCLVVVEVQEVVSVITQ